MQTSKLTEDLAVAGQIAVADVAALKAAGFRSIVCNRPDGEQPGQPSYAVIAAAAAEQGLEIRYQPLVPGQITPAHATEFAQFMDELPKPVLAYCRSGARSSSVWSMAAASKPRPATGAGAGAGSGSSVSGLLRRLVGGR